MKKSRGVVYVLLTAIIATAGWLMLTSDEQELPGQTRQTSNEQPSKTIGNALELLPQLEEREIIQATPKKADTGDGRRANLEMTEGRNMTDGPPSSQEAMTEQALDLNIEEVYNDGTLNTAHIDSDLVDSGRMFTQNISQLPDLPLGTPISLEIFGITYSGILAKSERSPGLGNQYVKVSLGARGQYMNIYYGKELARGKIYTADGAYIFQHNGESGFIMPIHEFKKLKNALVID